MLKIDGSKYNRRIDSIFPNVCQMNINLCKLKVTTFLHVPCMKTSKIDCDAYTNY